MPDADTSGLTHIAYWPDGMRMGWDGSKWVNLSPIDPAEAQSAAFLAQQRQQGISPQQAMQNYQKQLLPSQMPLGVQTEALHWNPEPSLLGRLASGIGGFFGSPNLDFLVAHPGEALKTAAQAWRQHPLNMAGRDVNNLVNTIAGDITFPIGLARSVLEQGPVATAESMALGPHAAEDIAAGRWGPLVGGILGNALGALALTRGVPAAAMELERVGGPLNIRTGALDTGQGLVSRLRGTLSGPTLNQTPGRALLEGANTMRQWVTDVHDAAIGTPDQAIIEADPVYQRIMGAADENAINNAVMRDPAMLDRFFERTAKYATSAGHPHFEGQVRSWSRIVAEAMPKKLRDQDSYVAGGIGAAAIGWKWVLGAATLGYAAPFLRRIRGLSELYTHPFRAGAAAGVNLPLLPLPIQPVQPVQPGPSPGLGGPGVPPAAGGPGVPPAGGAPGGPAAPGGGGGYVFGGPGSPQAMAAGPAPGPAPGPTAAAAAAGPSSPAGGWPWRGTVAGNLLQRLMSQGVDFEGAQTTLRNQGFTEPTIPKSPPPPGTPPPSGAGTGARLTGSAAAPPSEAAEAAGGPAASPLNPRTRVSGSQVQEALRQAAADPSGQELLRSINQARQKIAPADQPGFDRFVNRTIEQSVKDAQESVRKQRTAVKRARSEATKTQAATIADQVTESAGAKPKSDAWRRIAAEEGLDPKEFEPVALDRKQLAVLEKAMKTLQERQARRRPRAPEEIKRLERVREELNPPAPAEAEIKAIADVFERDWGRGEEISKWLRQNPKQVPRYTRKYVTKEGEPGAVQGGKPPTIPQRTAYRGYLIQPLTTGGFAITKEGHAIQNFVASEAEARSIVDTLAG